MQLDRTHVAIRIRTISEIGDLALVMIRRYPGALLVAFVLGALPWILLDYAILGYLPIREAQLGLNDPDAVPELRRFRMWFITLVFLQTPWAGAAATYYLGQAVFEAKPTYRSVFAAVRSKRWTLLWTLGILRGPLLWMWVPILRWGSPYNGFFDVFVPGAVLVLYGAVRGGRPFLPEILLLEQCPVRGKNERTITASLRSSRLHGPISGMLMHRGVVVSLVLVGLTLSFYHTSGTFLSLLTGNRSTFSLVPVLFLFPLALWIVAGISVFVRFLNYLDSRIRLEGWDVELAVRAEAIRQFGDDTGGPATNGGPPHVTAGDNSIGGTSGRQTPGKTPGGPVSGGAVAGAMG